MANQVEYSAVPNKKYSNMSPRKLAKVLDAETITLREVKNENGPKFCFLLADGINIGQASKSIRENLDDNGNVIIPQDAVVTRFDPKDGSDPYFILHPQGAGQSTVLYDASASRGAGKETTLV